MMVATDYGYSVEGELDSLISVFDFLTLCPGLSATTEQVQAVLDAVSAAVRDYCGWHVSPSLECDYTGSGCADLLMLPGMNVTSVDTLEISGDAVTDYEWTGAGMVRLTSALFPQSWRSVRCVYTAGYSSAVLAHVVAQIASNALVAAPGVSSERAGNVSVTYNQTGAGITGGISLLARDRELLARYRLAESR